MDDRDRRIVGISGAVTFSPMGSYKYIRMRNSEGL